MKPGKQTKSSLREIFDTLYDEVLSTEHHRVLPNPANPASDNTIKECLWGQFSLFSSYMAVSKNFIECALEDQPCKETILAAMLGEELEQIEPQLENSVTSLGKRLCGSWRERLARRQLLFFGPNNPLLQFPELGDEQPALGLTSKCLVVANESTPTAKQVTPMQNTRSIVVLNPSSDKEINRYYLMPMTNTLVPCQNVPAMPTLKSKTQGKDVLPFKPLSPPSTTETLSIRLPGVDRDTSRSEERKLAKKDKKKKKNTGLKQDIDAKKDSKPTRQSDRVKNNKKKLEQHKNKTSLEKKTNSKSPKLEKRKRHENSERKPKKHLAKQPSLTPAEKRIFSIAENIRDSLEIKDHGEYFPLLLQTENQIRPVNTLERLSNQKDLFEKEPTSIEKNEDGNSKHIFKDESSTSATSKKAEPEEAYFVRRIEGDDFVLCGNDRSTFYRVNPPSTAPFYVPHIGKTMVNFLTYRSDLWIWIHKRQQKGVELSYGLTLCSMLDESNPQEWITKEILTSPCINIHSGYLFYCKEKGIYMADIELLWLKLTNSSKKANQTNQASVSKDSLEIFDCTLFFQMKNVKDFCIEKNMMFVTVEKVNILYKISLDKLKANSALLPLGHTNNSLVSSCPLIFDEFTNETYINNVRVKCLDSEIVVSTSNHLILLDSTPEATDQYQSSGTVDFVLFKTNKLKWLVTLHRREDSTLMLLQDKGFFIISRLMCLEENRQAFYGIVHLEDNNFLVYGQGGYHHKFEIIYSTEKKNSSKEDELALAD